MFLSLWAYLDVLWPILVVGVIVYAAWGLGKRAARSSGYHFGVLGVAAVFLALAVLSFALGAGVLGIALLVIGLIVGALSFAGSAR